MTLALRFVVYHVLVNAIVVAKEAVLLIVQSDVAEPAEELVNLVVYMYPGMLAYKVLQCTDTVVLKRKRNN